MRPPQVNIPLINTPSETTNSTTGKIKNANAPKLAIDLANAKLKSAQDTMNVAFELFGDIDDMAETPHEIDAIGFDDAWSLLPAPDSFVFDDPEDAKAFYEAKQREMSQIIDDAFEKIFGAVFPDMTMFADALQWCSRAIRDGGTGINTNVEAALWERGRARLRKEASRDTADATLKYARAGWPLPPGAMLHATSLIQQQLNDKLAEQNRDIMVKSFEAELENVRFAVKTIGDLYIQSLQAVGEYVKTVMLGPQTAAELTATISGMKNDAAKTLVALYQAQSAALDPILKLRMTDADLKIRVEEANSRMRVAATETRVNAALAAAKAAGDMASASLNSLSVSTANNIGTQVN